MTDTEQVLIFDIEEDELEVFLDEVNEHLQVVESGILQLEQGADSDTLNAIFRGAHTIKALAGTVGHQQMAKLTHTMENLFDAMRQGELTPNLRIVDDLLEATDVLKAFRDEFISLRSSGVSAEAIEAKLAAISAEESDASVADPAGDTRANALHNHHSLTPEQIAQVEQAFATEQNTFTIVVKMDPNAFAPAARLMQASMALVESGQTIDQQPTADDLTQTKHDGWLSTILVTDIDVGVIKEKLSDIPDLADIQVHRLEPETLATFAPQPQGAKPKTAKPATNNSIIAEKTVRISVERLDDLMNLVGELVTNRNRLQRVETTLRQQYGKDEIVVDLSESSAHMGRVIDQLQEEVMRARMLPISNLFDKFPRIVRDVARASGKEVELVITGGNTELDRSLIEVIGDPLIHLLRNAVDHGVEPPEARQAKGKPPEGRVELSAAHVEGHIVITIKDDGNGIDPAKVRQAAVKRGLLSEEHAAQMSDDESVDLVFLPNLSTAEKLTDLSGRGVGMDVVRTNVERLSGAVFVESKLGEGTEFRVTLPLTLAIMDTMLVQMFNAVYAVPIASINDVLYLEEDEISTITGNQAIRWRGSVLPLIDLRDFFIDDRVSDTSVNLDTPVKADRRAVVSVSWGKQRAGLVVDKIIGKQGIVVKSLSPLLGDIAGLSGGTILGDGRIALIMDVPSLVNDALRSRKKELGVAV